MSIAQQDSDSYRGCGENMFFKIYSSTDAHIGAVISQLFYRTFVKMLPDYQIGSKPIKSIKHLLRNWTGGRHSRISKQPIVYILSEGDIDSKPDQDPEFELKPDPELCLKDVLEVLDWLFEEVQMSPDQNPYATNVCFLCRIQCVNAAQVVRGFKHTKHRPYDMVMAVFAAAHFMNGSEEEDKEEDKQEEESNLARLEEHFKKFARMYLDQCKTFDYQAKDVYKHMETLPFDPMNNAWLRVYNFCCVEAKPMETIHYLFERIYAHFAVGQKYVLSSAQLTVHDVIVSLEWLFEKVGPLETSRFESVDAQQVNKQKTNTKHRPYDFLIAIISASFFLSDNCTSDDKIKLTKFYHEFMPKYLLQCGSFDCVEKDLFSHKLLQPATVRQFRLCQERSFES
jgi:hypothetical protein